MRLQMIRARQKKGPLLLPLHLYSFWLKDQKWLAEQKRFAVSAKINESECRKLWGVRHDLATSLVRKLSWSYRYFFPSGLEVETLPFRAHSTFDIYFGRSFIRVPYSRE